MINRIINFLNIKNYPADKRKQFKFNVGLGVFILFFFIAVKDTAIIQASLNSWLDYYIMFRMDSKTDTHTAAQKITFLDFDNKSFQTLGKPDLTPRDKVAELLNIAYKGNAEVVILDFDFLSAKKFRKAGLNVIKFYLIRLKKLKMTPPHKRKLFCRL